MILVDKGFLLADCLPDGQFYNPSIKQLSWYDILLYQQHSHITNLNAPFVEKDIDCH